MCATVEAKGVARLQGKRRPGVSSANSTPRKVSESSSYLLGPASRAVVAIDLLPSMARALGAMNFTNDMVAKRVPMEVSDGEVCRKWIV